jgi:hypothetical protein
MIDGLHGGGAHLLALAAARWSLFGSRLAIMLPEARIHIDFDVGRVLQNVVNNSFLECPPEEIQLADSGLLDRGLAADLERDAFATTEGVEEALAVRLELAFVLEVDDELLIIEKIADIELLGVVRDEPLDNTETHGGGTCQKGSNLLNAPRLIIEILEPANNKLLFSLNTAFRSSTCGVHSCSHRYSIGFKWTQLKSWEIIGVWTRGYRKLSAFRKMDGVCIMLFLKDLLVTILWVGLIYQI